MKKILLTIIIMCLTNSMLGCSYQETPPHQKNLINNKQYYKDTDKIIASMTAYYPMFNNPEYEALNESIVNNEVQQWQTIYAEIINRAYKGISVDESLISFNRYLKTNYKINFTSNEVSVTFYVEWSVEPSSYEPKYTRTYTISEGIVYSTTVVSERIY